LFALSFLVGSGFGRIVGIENDRALFNGLGSRGFLNYEPIKVMINGVSTE
jgi:hypothetical protein